MDTNIKPSAKAPDTPATKLASFNKLVQTRYSEVSNQFEGSEIDPTKTTAFKRFIADHLAMLNSWYVITGEYKDFIPLSDQDKDPATALDKKLEEKGFGVSGKKTLDPFLSGNEAALHAAAEGALDDDPDEDGLSPKTVKPI